MKLQTINISSAKGYIAIAGVLVAGAISQAQAQTTPADSILNRTVIVEQQYNPDIMDAQKINVVPQVEEIKVIPRQVEYDSQIFPATSLPGETINAFAGKEEQEKARKGFARLGYGMYGNLDVKANYLFTLGEKDKLNLNFSMDGRDGKLWWTGDPEKWNNHFYRTRAAMNYVHQFNKVDMDIAADFGLSNFNYMYVNSPLQKKFTSGSGHVGLVSTDSELPVQFKAETNLMLYTRNVKEPDPENYKETIIRTKADFIGNLNDEQQVGVAFEMNNRYYSFDEYKDFTTLLLNPYYAIHGENWNVHLGVNVDLAFSFGSKFNVSPDVKAEYIFSDSYILYAKATGGRLMNDYRRLENLDPFADFHRPSSLNTQIEDSYRQLDGRIGFKASPASGLWFNLYGGYEKTKKDLFTRMEQWIPRGRTTHYYLTNSSNVFVGADLSYDYKNIFSIALDGKYQSWDSGIDTPSLLMPEFTFNGEIGVRPIDKLNITLGYQFIQRKKIENEDKLNAVNNLRLGGSYELFDGISIYARAYNLLNKKYFYYINYYDQGASFLGGLSFRF